MYLKSLKFRFTIVFSVVFIAGAAALYVVSYILVSSFLQREEQELLDAKFLEFWAVYQTGRTAAVQREFTPENLVTESTAFFVRIADRNNVTTLLFHPASWREYNLDSLAEAIPSEGISGVALSGTDGSILQVVSVRLFDGNYLQVGVSNRQRVALLDNLRRVYLLVSVPFAMLGIVGGWIVASRGLKPVKNLSTLSRFIIETGELSRRIPPLGSRDELDELTLLFNRMLEKIETLITGMRSSLDNVAHDLRTPMTRIRMKADSALNAADQTSKPVFEAIVAETEQMLTMMTTLMDISGAETGVMRLELERVDFGRIIGDMSELYSYTAAEKGVDVSTDIESPLIVSIDVNRMRQVVANLIDNAMKYTITGGVVKIHGFGIGGSVFLDVRDTGIGIDPEDMPQIWDRLFRGDKSRTQPGLGLGLGLVKAIVEAHGGEVSAQSPVTGQDGSSDDSHPGALFRVSIPAATS